MKSIGIIILNRQSWQDTLACLESLQTLIYTKPISIIVCNKGSVQGEKAIPNSQFPNSWVYHKGSASVGNVRDGNRDKLRRANYYENLSTLKYTANFYPRLLPLVMVSRFVGKSAALISRGDFYLFAPLFRAYWDFIRCRCHRD